MATEQNWQRSLNLALNIKADVPAPLGARLIAAALDLLVLTVVTNVLFLVLARVFGFADLMERMGSGILDPNAIQMSAVFAMLVSALLMLVACHAYFIYFEWHMSATPGKRIMGLKVISLNGGILTKKQAVTRDLMRWYVDGLMLIPFFISVMSSSKRQRVGDHKAHTMVVLR